MYHFRFPNVFPFFTGDDCPCLFEKFKKTGIFIFPILLFFSCQTNPSIPASTPFTITQPPLFPKMDIPVDNPLTVEGIALGKQLFFDPILSADHTMSCGSCHFPDRGFTDNLPVSKGIHGKVGKRSAMSLLNIGYMNTGLFWDGRTDRLETQALLPVADSSELAHQWQTVEWDLRKHQNYPDAFRHAFGIQDTGQLTRTLVVRAIAQYERSLVSSGNSRYDRFRKGELELTADEMMGYDLFFDISPEVKDAECGNCHNAPLFTTNEYNNNGVQAAKTLEDFKDSGRGMVTGNRYDNGKFRIPTLRNIELTAPYMHDGRFATLEKVVDHYNKGGQISPNINSLIRPLGLTQKEKEQLIVFLKTLTEEEVY